MKTSRIQRQELCTEPAAEDAADLAQLLSLVAHGDHQAFEMVYGVLAAPVYGMVLRVLRDPAQSAEVTQEVLLEVWLTAYRYDKAKGRPAAWALTIAHRRAIDRVRSETAWNRYEQEAAVDRSNHEHGSLDEVGDCVADLIEQQQMRDCLDSLSKLQRESVTLAYFGGYSYPQVAALLGVPLGTVKARIRDGLIRLRECLT